MDYLSNTDQQYGSAVRGADMPGEGRKHRELGVQAGCRRSCPSGATHRLGDPLLTRVTPSGLEKELSVVPAG